MTTYPTRRAAGLLGFAALAAACGSDPVSPPPLIPADVVGTYALASINGQRLPAPFGQGTAVIYDTLTLARDSTWTEWGGGGALGSSVVTDSGTYTGRWTLNATAGQVQLTFTDSHNYVSTSPYTISDRGATLTFNAGPVNPANPGGGLWVFSRVP